jgi:hypothetical protein
MRHLRRKGKCQHHGQDRRHREHDSQFANPACLEGAKAHDISSGHWSVAGTAENRISAPRFR